MDPILPAKIDDCCLSPYICEDSGVDGVEGLG